MYLDFMIGLLAAGAYRRKPDHRASDRTSHVPPPDLAGLSDHQLRDVGYEGERVRVSFRHLLRM